MTAIFKREFRSFFQSMIGYVFIAATLLLIGVYFFAYNLSGAYPYFSYTLSACVYIFLITIPLLTMKVLSEDRKNKTDQLILTAPVNVGTVVLGKFLAVAVIFVIVIAIVSFYPLIMSLYGTVPMKETYGAILGFTFYGLAGIAAGIFVSSLTESQIIAAVLTFAVMLLTYIVDGLCSLISSTGNLFTDFLGLFDFYSRFNTFLQGTISLTSVVYFLSVIALMLFFTTQSIQKRRYTVSVKNFKMGAYSTTAVVLVTGVVVVLNLIVNAVPEKYTIFDLTDNSLYTLTSETKTMLKELDQPVTVYVYCNEDDFDQTSAGILARYEAETSNLRVSYIDPVLDPQFTKKYSNSQVSTGSLIVVNGDKSRVINYSDLYEYSYDYSSYNYESTLTGIDVEGQVTSAIAFVTSDESHSIYYTSGHREETLEDAFTDVIAKANVTYKEIDLLTADSIPEDAECVIVNSPEGDLNEYDIEKLKEYADKGGKIIVTLMASGEERPLLTALLKEYGLELYNSVILEGNRNNYIQNPMYILPEVESFDAITTDVYKDYYIFAPYALAMKQSEELPEGVAVSELLYTTETSFAKDLTAELTTYDKEEGDITGPFVIGAKAVKTIDEETASELVVFSCGNLFTSSANSMVSGGNVKLFSSLIASCVDIDSNVSIPVKSYDAKYLTLTNSEVAWWRNVTIILIPGAFLVYGLIIWLRRRRK